MHFLLEVINNKSNKAVLAHLITCQEFKQTLLEDRSHYVQRLKFLLNSGMVTSEPEAEPD